MYRSWNHLLDEIKKMPDCSLFEKQLNSYAKSERISPEKKDIFKVFKLTPFEEVKVIILNQAPYGYSSVDNGLAYASKVKETRALRNIFKEIGRVYKEANLIETNLEYWAKQGVLLLNTSITCKEKEPVAHAALWKPFTLRVIKYFAAKSSPTVWMLWGDHAKMYEKFLNKTDNNHLVLKAEHPREESFVGCNHFYKANNYLDRFQIKLVDWATDDLPF